MATGWVTVLLRLPLFYNPDATGARAPVEDQKFLRPVEHLTITEEEVQGE